MPGALEPESSDPAQSGLDRMASLSDGVFSVALTLLVLPVTDLRVREEYVLGDLLGLIPQLFAFALSFLVIGRFWLSHHDDLRDMTGVTRRLLVANLGFLFFVVLLPFPSALLGETGGRTATVIYALAIMATAIMSVLLWRVAGADGLLRDRRAREDALAKEYGTATLVVGFLPSLPLAFVAPSLAQLSWLLALPAGMAGDRWRRHRLRLREAGAADDAGPEPRSAPR